MNVRYSRMICCTRISLAIERLELEGSEWRDRLVRHNLVHPKEGVNGVLHNLIRRSKCERNRAEIDNIVKLLEPDVFLAALDRPSLVLELDFHIRWDCDRPATVPQPALRLRRPVAQGWYRVCG